MVPEQTKQLNIYAALHRTEHIDYQYPKKSTVEKKQPTMCNRMLHYQNNAKNHSSPLQFNTRQN